MKFGFFRAKFSRGVFPFFPSALEPALAVWPAPFPRPDSSHCSQMMVVCWPMQKKKKILWSKFSVPYTAGSVEEGNLLRTSSVWDGRHAPQVDQDRGGLSRSRGGTGWQGRGDALQACWGSSCGHSDLHPMAIGCVFSSSLHIPRQPQYHPRRWEAQQGDPPWSCLRRRAPICRNLPHWETFLRPLLAPNKQLYTLWRRLCWIFLHTAQPTVYHVTIYKLPLKLHK